jgi:hypothetical protein
VAVRKISQSAPHGRRKCERWSGKGMLSTDDKLLTDRLSPPVSAPTPFVLIACQRAGAHLFTEIVNSNPFVALAAEPFSPLPKPVSWANYVRTLPRKQYPPLLPDDAMTLLDEHMNLIHRDVYLDRDSYGGRKARLRALGLDVKYNQLRSVTSLLADLRSPPLLLDYFRSRNFRVVHLVRSNIVHAALSLIIAKFRNVWTNDGCTTIEGKFWISWEMLLHEIQWMQEERDEFLRWADEAPLHTCAYEDLVVDLGRIDEVGNFPDDTAAVRPLAELLGVPNSFRYTGRQHKVINRPFAEILGGYDDLVRAIRDSEFSEFADTI